MSDDLQRIQNDIARCKERIAQIESGRRGVISETYAHQNAGRAHENQLNAQRQALENFELEYVHACLAEHRWSPAAIIERMQAPAAPAGAPAQPVREIVTIREGDVTRGKLQSLLEDNPGNFVPRSKLLELLSK